MIEEDQALTTRALARRLQVSEMTVRRDLEMLDWQHRIHKVRGGAVHRDSALVPASRKDEKRALLPKLAAAVTDLVEESMVVGIQAGNATAAIIEALSEIPRLTLVTNWMGAPSVVNAAAHEINFHRPRLLLTPGSPHGHDELGGPLAVAMLRSVRTDIAFLNVCGPRENFGFLAASPERVEIAETFAANSRIPVAVLDQDGAGRAGSFRLTASFPAEVIALSATMDEREKRTWRQYAAPVIET